MHMPKLNSVIIFIVFIVIALITLNLLIVFGVFDTRFCTRVENYDAKICGVSNPVEEIKALIKSSPHIDIIFESDKDATQTGAEMAKVLMSFSEQLSIHDLSFYGISMENGKKIECNEGQRPLEFCESIKPTEKSALIYVYYPSGKPNELDIKERTIYFKSNSVENLRVLAELVFYTVLNS